MIDSTNTGQSVLISPLWKKPFYSQPSYSRGCGVPSLVWICLQCIAEFPDQVQLHHKLVYQPPQPLLNDIDEFLASTLTGRCSKIPDARDKRDLLLFDPRLWAVIVQTFDYLPLGLRTYTISLNDEALPLLQQIPNTATFSLMTILELPSCVALTDSSIFQLKDLHTLAAFDASGTRISSYGLLTLARTLQMNDPLEATRRLRGPWALRILRLKHCTGVDDAVYATLPKFPLLSVVDLRGTNCHPHTTTLEFPFSPNADKSLFSSDMVQSLNALQNHEDDVRMYSATKEYRFTLRIKTLCHETIAKSLNPKNDHCRPPLEQPSRIFADDYDSHRTDEDWSDQCNDGEEGAFDDTDEREQLGENVSEEWEEQVSGEEIDEKMEEYGDSDEKAIATKQLIGLQERNLNESQKITDDPLIRPTMVSRPYLHSKQDHKHSQMVLEDPPTMSSFPNKLLPFCDRRKPHWYDADWAREHSYVPMSLAKREYDGELMLYRPARPWNLLESELDIQLAKEARREQVRADGYNHGRGPDLVAPPDTKNLQVQEDMKSLSAEALRRRRIHNPPPRNEPSRTQSRNPFARKPTEVLFPARQINGQPKGKPLKPISALRVPKITRELLQQIAKGDSCSAGPKNEYIQPSAITKSCTPTAKSPMRGSLTHSTRNNQEPAGSVFTNLREENSSRKTIRRTERIPMSSGSMVFSPVAPSVKERGGGKGGQKSQSPRFDWAAWASKKS